MLSPLMRTLLTATLLFILAEFATGQITDVQIDAYLNTTLDHALETKDEALDRWKERFAAFGDENNIVSELIGYQPPNFLALMADISSHLYERTGEEEYAAITRELLLEIPALRALFPEEFRTRVEYQIGVPAVNWFRTLPVYAIAYMRTAESGVYSAEDREIVSEAVASSVDIVFAFPEWGAMNRALLRAESFMAAWRAFPDHPNAARWKKMGEILAEDSIGKWEIEDASIYHAVWMRAYVGYIDMAGLTDAYDSPILKYYFDYLVALMTPDGSIPEFGDGRWNTSLNEYHLALERGAREYQSSSMKWAANRMFEHMGGTTTTRAGDTLPGPAFDTPSVGFARILINRRIHGDPFLEATEPTNKSGDALDEIIAKKIVMRSGWGQNATYLMLNYKDEGFSSVWQKDYLKHVLAVEEEKMHHGHSDENSISLFMKDGTYLLMDAGYRPYAPSGAFGAWRSDFFHNRIVVRNRRKAVDEGYFDVIRDAGTYNTSVRTSKLDFQSLPAVDYSRTRLEDDRTGYRWDRILVRDKSEDFVIVVDAVKFLRSDYFTVVNLWHTRQIVEEGPNWFVTRYDSLGGVDENPGNLDLLVLFPYDHETGTEPISRSNQNEVALFQGASRYFQAGWTEPMVTVLIPFERGADAQAAADRFELVKHDESVVSLSIQRDGTTELIGFKLDPDNDILQEDVRPRYTFDSSKRDYGRVTTDADFFHVTTGASPKFSATHLVRFDLDGETLFDAPESQFFQTWGRSDRKGRAKWRRWDNY